MMRFEIPKNRREVLIVEVKPFAGSEILSARVWFRPEGSEELRPGKDGWAIKVEALDQLINGLTGLKVMLLAREGSEALE